MNINNNSRNSYPLLLKNAPCNEDLFEGKSHQDIANAISKTIITQEDATIIGIDGGWGSGKSNLVGLVKNMLSNESSSLNYHFFVYDAWGHQDDLQRRSILEELTDQLINGNKQQNQTPVLEKAKWSKKLKSLLARKREVETKSVPKLSIGIIASIAMLILTPIAGVVSDLIPEANSLCKVIIAVTPLTIGLLFMSYFRIKSMRKYGQAITFESFMSELFLIYQDKIKEDVTFETISEKEPSSREFKSWIHEIDNDLSDDKLVIVFDNMDRLPATKVQELWAVIHSFFADEKYKNICVIVPFDRAHIISAFKNENITQINNSEIANVPIEGSEPDSIGANVIQKTTFKDLEIKCYGDDFINKTFNVIYRVSPPTMSNWKRFFNDKWKNAFGDILSDNSRITQIYDLLTEHQTPRKIIAFINEFVALKQICSKHNIPDEYFALFIFGKDKIILNPEKEIITPTYLGAMEFRYKNDKNMSEYICAIYYQLPPKNAIDLIYTETIKRALDKNDSEVINSVKTLPQFKNLLENAIAKITNAPNAIVALNTCFGSESDDETRRFWDDLYGHARGALQSKLQEYQKILLQRITNSTLLQ